MCLGGGVICPEREGKGCCHDKDVVFLLTVSIPFSVLSLEVRSVG
jgi:hypothetical protein